MGSPSRLDILAPGLLGPWPAAQVAFLCENFDAPALALLLARGRVSAPLPTDGSLAGAALALFGRPVPGPAAAAAYRSDAPEGADVSGPWLRLDPVHLRAEPHGAAVVHGRRLDLTPEEARALASELAGIRDLPAPQVLEPTRWYLPLAADIEMIAPSGINGPMAGGALPAGPDGARWRAWLTEAQMILHASRVNERREAAGQPAVNSLWLWGAGQLEPATGEARYDRVWADDPVLRGLALAEGASVADGLARLEAAAASGQGNALVLYGVTHGLAANGNVEGWRAAVDDFETAFAGPLVALLRAGTPDAIRLVMPPNATVTVTRGDLRRFWRRRRPLASMLERLA